MRREEVLVLPEVEPEPVLPRDDGAPARALVGEVSGRAAAVDGRAGVAVRRRRVADAPVDAEPPDLQLRRLIELHDVVVHLRGRLLGERLRKEHEDHVPHVGLQEQLLGQLDPEREVPELARVGVLLVRRADDDLLHAVRSVLREDAGSGGVCVVHVLQPV